MHGFEVREERLGVSGVAPSGSKDLQNVALPGEVPLSLCDIPLRVGQLVQQLRSVHGGTLTARQTGRKWSLSYRGTGMLESQDPPR